MKLAASRHRARLFCLCVAVLLSAVFFESRDLSASEAEIELPLTYSGDGMTLVIKTLDEDEGTCTGTVALQGQAASVFTARFQEDAFGNEVGLGEVLTPNGSLPIRSRDDGERGTVVEYGGRVYRLKLVEPGAPAENPSPTPPTVTEGRKGTPRVTSQVGTSKKAAPTVVLRKHTFKDPGSANMDSHTVLAPKGWKVEGGPWWTRQAYFNVLPSQDIKITAPDGRRVHLSPSIVAKDIIPSAQYGLRRPAEGTADQGYPVIYKPETLQDWTQWVANWSLPKAYPGATNIRIVNGVVVPELTALLKRRIDPLCSMILQQNQVNATVGMKSFCDGAVLAFEYRYTHEGRDWEEFLMFGTTYTGFDGPAGRNVLWDIDAAVSYRAPAGQLEANLQLLKTIGDSLRTTPQWARMRADHQAKLSNIARKGAAERSRIIAQSNREINEIITKGYERRQAIQDRTHERVINSIRDTEDYVIPGTNEYVQLPSYYDKVYTNGSGDYILTSDQLYDPNTDTTINSQQWQTMEVRP